MHVLEEQKSHTYNLSSYLKNLEKQSKINPKQGEERINIRAEIKTENKLNQ